MAAARWSLQMVLLSLAVPMAESLLAGRVVITSLVARMAA
jgi:hypothetical protein